MSGSKTAFGVLGGVLLIAAIGGGALLYAKPDWIFKVSATPAIEEAQEKSDLARFAVGPLATLQTPKALPATPAYVFKTREGAEARIADFKGKVLVLNVWAMWCAPCRTEMPTLATLAREYAGKDVAVVPVNVDVGDDSLADAKSFIDVHEPLPLYLDPKFQLPFELPGKGAMPRTVIFDKQGRMRAWFTGEADWASPQVKALIDALLAEPA